jgi:cysteinyl-tRNA synthetase
MKLFDTFRGEKATFTPAEPGRPTMYVCGPTVYNHPHIGNARSAVVFDVLFRHLKARFGDCVYVRNITDIDDKIIAASAESGEPWPMIVERYARAYGEDMAALNVLPPTVEPRATEHVAEMLRLIERLIERGQAYEAEGHVLFHVPSFEGYGRLSRRSREEMIDGARVEVAPYKRDPADFVLWKPSGDDQPGWDSRFGRGRPGWHIECSAMVEKHIGRTADIHGGGLDLKFPHHENELAQSACAHDGEPLARFWLHNGFLDIEREKMAKSLGNVVLVKDLLAEVPGEVVRFALLQAHYRKPLDWTGEGLAQARHGLDRLYRALEAVSGAVDREDLPVPEGVGAALDDDLNTPMAFAEMFELARTLNASRDQDEQVRLARSLLGGARLLGLLESEPQAWFRQTRGSGVDEAEIERLIERRARARKERQFAEADRIRDQLADMGVVIEDGPAGTRWRLAG